MDDLATRWRAVDRVAATWWVQDRTTASRADVAADPDGDLLYLPHPYVPAGTAAGPFHELYGWDTHFTNLGLLAHGRPDQVRFHILDQLHLIDEYGMVLNGNRRRYRTRSQPPVLADSVAGYLRQVPGDDEIRRLALQGIGREYHGYWCAPHHSTPTGLTTNRDIGTDLPERAELAAENETGLDYSALFDGDVRTCVPLITNSALVRTAEVLTQLAAELGDLRQAEAWRAERERRAGLIRELCWDEADGFFKEYQWVAGRQLPVKSLSAYWTLLAGIATKAQANRMVAALDLFRRRNGVLAATSQVEPSPHPEWAVLQWHDPVVWPPYQVVVVDGLRRYGYEAEARTVAESFLRLQVEVFEQTGELWEKYNGVTWDQHIPVERYPSVPMHGWSAGALAHLGHYLYG